MREIVFRGKHTHIEEKNEHLDGTWIYGYLCDDNYINSLELGGEFMVDKNTVCQYTGIKDRNGKMIFEGDILRNTSKSKDYVVGFYGGSFCLINKKMKCKCFLCVNEKITKKYKVVGNIFDNPGLFQFEKEPEKEIVYGAEIVVRATKHKPYYEIVYHSVRDNQIHMGFPSYYLNNVLWCLEKYFVILGENKTTEEIPNTCDTDKLVKQLDEALER